MANKDKDTVKLTITGLNPDTDYALQVRAFNENGHSPWSDKFNLITINDTTPIKGPGQGAPNRPKMIQDITWEAVPGGFLAEWEPVTRDGYGTRIVVKHYEIQVTRLGVLDRTVSVVPSGSGRQSRLFSFPELKAMFRETPGVLEMKMRVVNSVNNASLWSETYTAAVGKPPAPTNAVGTPIVDGIVWTWDAPADTSKVRGYRVYSAPEAFGPDFPVTANNRVYEGTHPGFTWSSTNYGRHWFRIVAFGEAEEMGAESDPLMAGPLAPLSGFAPDETPPKTPTITDVTLNRADPSNATATISWTHDDNDAQNKDTTNYVIRHRLAGTTYWEYTNFSKDMRQGSIPIRSPFSNYEVQIAALDYVANYAEYGPVPPRIIQGADTTPPPKTTGVTVVGSLIGVAIKWDASTAEDVLYSGVYEIVVAPSPDFITDALTYRTRNTFLDVVGLDAGQTYYVRVRAIDPGGLNGEWSDTKSASTGQFPEPDMSDGNPPASSPAARVVSSMGFIGVSWDRITNNDLVTYEVHMSDQSGFNPSLGSTQTLLTTSTGTSATVTALPNGQPLVTGKTYYFRVIATDVDTNAQNAPSAGTVGSGHARQVGPADLGINMPGENLYLNSSFDTDSNGDGVADYWLIYNNSGSAQPTTPSLVPGRTGGFAQRVSWSVPNTTTKGVYSSTAGGTVVKPHTEYTVSFYARANGGNGFLAAFNKPPAGAKWISNPAPSATEWQRYIYTMKTGADPDPSNVYLSISGHNSANGWVEFDDMQIEAGNMASAYKTGTVSIAKLTTGRFTTSEFILSTGGIIKSENFNDTNKKGFALSNERLILHEGEVDAKTLRTDSAIVGNLFIGSAGAGGAGSLTVASGGEIKSANYNGDPNSGPLVGYRLTSAGLDIAKGVIRAETLTGNIVSPDVKIGVNGRITIDDSGSIRSNNYSPAPLGGVGTGWKIDKNGIEIWGTESLIRAESFKGGTFSGNYFNVGSGGYIQSEDYNEVQKVGWRIGKSGSASVMNMFGGKIFGSEIETNQIKSATRIVDGGGTERHTFAITADGRLSASHMMIFGNATIGTTGANNIHSRIVSADFSSGVQGWMIRGDGYAEFNSGRLKVGGEQINSGSRNGSVELLSVNGVGEVRLYLPDTTGSYHYIRTNGLNEVGFYGAAGAHVKLHGGGNVPNGEGGWQWLSNLVGVAQNFYVSNFTVLDAGLRVNYGGAVVRGGMEVYSGFRGNGEIRFSGLAQANGGQDPVMVGASGTLHRGSSSLRYKTDIQPLRASTESILALEPKNFQWTTEINGYNEDVGFIAEEADALGLSDFVIYRDVEGEVKPDGFRYLAFVAAQQKVLRHQNDEIQQLKARLESLESAT